MVSEFEKDQWDNENEAKQYYTENLEGYKQLFHNFVIRNHGRYVKMYQRKFKRYGIIIKFIK